MGEQENIEQPKKEIVNYKGSLDYYFRHCGLEEGAHAAFFVVKGNKDHPQPESIDKTADDIEDFKGDKKFALTYCKSFLDGVKIPIKKVFGEDKTDLKFGFAIPKEGEEFYDFFFHPETKTVYINRNSLERFSQPPFEPNIQIASTTSEDYSSQKHEKRALIWQIKDAREHGQNELADLLVKIKNNL